MHESSEIFYILSRIFLKRNILFWSAIQGHLSFINSQVWFTISTLFVYKINIHFYLIAFSIYIYHFLYNLLTEFINYIS